MDIAAQRHEKCPLDIFHDVEKNKLQRNKIVQINKWKQVNVLFFRKVDIVQSLNFS